MPYVHMGFSTVLYISFNDCQPQHAMTSVRLNCLLVGLKEPTLSTCHHIYKNCLVVRLGFCIYYSITVHQIVTPTAEELLT